MTRPCLAIPQRRFVVFFAILCCFVFAGVNRAPATVDLNDNGMSDVWEMVYGAAGLSPGADADGDGLANLKESIAGTNPFDPSSTIRVSVIASGSSVLVSWPSIAGKSYQLQTTGALTSGTWANYGSPIPGTGATLTETAIQSGSIEFFRVSVSDVDTNGDGLSDWESLQLLLDPANAYSNGNLDGNGQPISDYAYVTAALTATNAISIEATKPSATIPDNNPATDLGTLVITRSGNLNAVTVNLAVSGTAVENTDFATLPRSVKFPIGVRSETVTVTPLAGSGLKSGREVKMTVMPGGNYVMGSATTAAVVIYPSQTPAGTGLTAQYWPNGNPTYPGTNFTGTNSVTRIDPTIDFYWGKGQPYTSVNRSNFSASWDGRISPPTTGNYLFALQAHDGARLYISGTKVIDGWTLDTSATTPMESGTIALTAGQLYTAHVDYYETTGSATIYLTWQTPTSSSFAKIPAADVIQTGTTTTGWTANYYNNTTETAPIAHTVVESGLYWNWGAGSPDPSLPTTHYSARWTGQIEPEYSEPYTFVTHADDGVKLWVNDQLITNDWVDQSASDMLSIVINLQAGVRYDIKMEYFEDVASNAEAHLSWFSPSQPQEVVPQKYLYPASVSAAPSNVTSPTTAVALVGGTFSYTVSASNLPTSYSITGLPAGLTFNPATGVISGTPLPGQAGNYQILITATNASGTGASTVSLNIIDTGRAITRDIWTGIAGTQVSVLTSGSNPIVNTTPSLTGTLTTLEGITGYGNNYGERIRGYITAPITGNYYFWLSGSDTVQLWVSNDSEPVNKVQRASVINGTAPRVWTSGTTQQSPWLAMVAGQKYYVEVLHKVGTGSGDNVAVGWLRPDQSGTVPSEIVPAYALSPYTAPKSSGSSGTLYTASMLAESGVASKAVGSATLELNGTQATVTFSYSDLSSPITAEHIDSEPYLNDGTQILFDLAADAPGTYTWKIKPTGPLAVSDILEILSEGKAYFNVLTADYPNGEISGNFTLAAGAQSFTPPPPPPSWTDDHNTDAGASRFLIQSTFGPTPSEIARVESLGYSAWIADQFTRPASHHLPVVLSHPQTDPGNTYTDTLMFNAWWQQSVTAPDQLRQRVAFALSEILVVSDVGSLNNNGRILSSYYDTLLDNSFGNFRNLLEAVALTPAMGNYLGMRANAKGSEITGLHPDENFAREIMQLFSIGLNRMWPDGTLVENSQGSLVPTYGQNVVQGYAAVFTGWNYNQALQGNGRLPTNFNPAADYTDPMVMVPSQHDQGAKQIIDNIVLPAASGSQTDSSQAAYDTYATQDFETSLNALFNNQNVAPLICRQLIQRLVTSNPSRDYVYRVTQAFNDNGSGVRGDLQAVIKAILLDYQARSSTVAAQPDFGKQREALLRVTAPARYFASTVSVSGSYSQTGTQTILVTSTTPVRVSNGDAVVLNFTSGTPLPTSANYTVAGVSGTASKTFTVTAMGLTTGTYSQTGSTITANLSGHGLQVGNPVYLAFTSGGAGSGLFQVATVADSAHFAVTGTDSATRSGNCLISKFSGGYVSTSGTITLDTSSNHGLSPGNSVFIHFSSGTALTGTYSVLSTPDLTHFTVYEAGLSNQSHNSLTAYPLVPPPLNRSGAITGITSTFNMGVSDNTITQSPLNSPTVFNYYYPDFSFPGAIESAGLTTPEFQLTNASNVMVQTNYLEQGMLGSGDQTGLTSFSNGNGVLMMDMGPYLSMASDANTPSLVDLLNNQLMGGGMSSSMRSTIISNVANETNYPYSNPPTTQQLSNRVRAIVHLIITSAEFTIQQ